MLVIQHAIHAGCVDSNDDVVVGSRNSSLPMKRVVHLSRFLLSDLLRPLYLSTRFYLTKYIQKKTHTKKKKYLDTNSYLVSRRNGQGHTGENMSCIVSSKNFI